MKKSARLYKGGLVEMILYFTIVGSGTALIVVDSAKFFVEIRNYCT